MEDYTGKRLDGRYEIQEIVGVGGMAVVYKAYDNIDDRTVAVKILKDEFLANEEFRRRFKNESKAIAVLSHPNIVKVYDVSYGDRLQYIVMEYVEGITLKEYIQQQGVINSREAVFFVMQILRALQHAHDKGIIHRDIKPQNILLLENGAIKVTDFGIARFSASETRTMTDSAIGSVHYISPEQARGDITNDKADIYSVGVMLYEMLTGKLPFESDNTVSVAIMQLQQDPVMPREINPTIPVGLEQIVIRAMQKNVSDRYQSAAEMLLDLEEFKRNTSIRFDYEYNNNEPTKFIPTVKPQSVKSNIDIEPEVIEEEEPPVVKNRTIPILLGIILALLVGVGGIVFAIYKSDDSGQGLMSSLFDSKEKVPHLVGQIYSEEEMLNKYSDLFAFEVKTEIDPEKEINEIISQDPKPGERVKKGSVIKLVIAISNETRTIPADLIGKQYTDVYEALDKEGFTVQLKEIDSKDYSGEIDAGTVVNVSPKSGTSVSKGSKVTVEYISFEGTKEELVIVPDLSKLELGEAKSVLSGMNISYSVNEDYSDTIKKGYVITNSYANVKVPVSTSVTVTVSLGKKVEHFTNVSITLPVENVNATITASLNGKSVSLSKSNVYLDGSSYQLPVTGSGSASKLKVFLNGQTYFECTIDFSDSDCDISNYTYYPFEEKTTESTTSSKISVPDVNGKTAEAASEAILNAGFKESPYIQYQTVYSEDESGCVIEQYPAAGSSESSSTQITIIIGDYKSDSSGYDY